MRGNSSLGFVKMSIKAISDNRKYGLEPRSIFECPFSKLICALKVSQVVHAD